MQTLLAIARQSATRCCLDEGPSLDYVSNRNVKESPQKQTQLFSDVKSFLDDARVGEGQEGESNANPERPLGRGLRGER
jgi:hypothetical protein